MIVLNRLIPRYKIFFLFVFIISLSGIVGVRSQSLNSYQDTLQCEYLAKEAEVRYGLPENILLSISRVETGYQKVDGVRRAWPWTLNAGGDSAYFQTKDAALKSLKKRVKQGVTNIDIGCMQLNFRWHKKFFKNLSDMMSPEKNVDYGARFLNRLHKRHGSWEKAVKYYHSSKSKFNVKYYKKVRAVWKKENNEPSLKPILVAAVSKPEPNKINILRQRENSVPLIEINKSDQGELIKKTVSSYSRIEETKPIVVSTANFQKTLDKGSEFDFTSFVKSLSRKNTAFPKYIRDNWTIVLSIRNELENSN